MAKTGLPTIHPGEFLAETLEELGLPFGVIVELFDGVAKLSGLDGKEVTAKAGN